MASFGEEWEKLDTDDDTEILSLLASHSQAHSQSLQKQIPPQCSNPPSVLPLKRPFLSHTNQTYGILDRFKRKVTNNDHNIEENANSEALPVPSAPPSPKGNEGGRNSVRLIPGPAGALQKRISRTTGESSHRAGDVNPAYVENPDEDPDFIDDNWLQALKYICPNTGNTSDMNFSIKSITSLSNRHGCIDRVPQVLGIVKTLVPDKLGNMSISIKDPTGTIDGSVYHKVFEESEFGKDIAIGSVILLQQVVVFSPTPWAHYLNITTNNVAKVFKKGSFLAGRQRAFSSKENQQSFNADFIEAGSSRAPKNQYRASIFGKNRTTSNTDMFSQAAEEYRRTNLTWLREKGTSQNNVFSDVNLNEKNAFTHMNMDSDDRNSLHNIDQPLSFPIKLSDRSHDLMSTGKIDASINPLDVNKANDCNTEARLNSASESVEAYSNKRPSLPVTIDWDEEVEMLMADQPDIFG